MHGAADSSTGFECFADALEFNLKVLTSVLDLCVSNPLRE